MFQILWWDELFDKSASDLYFLVPKQKNKKKNQMRNEITMEMSICQAENGFSLDELVKKVADSYKNKAFADILKMNLQLTQEVLMYRIFNDKSNMHCCSDGHLTLNGSFDRRIWTSLGEFKSEDGSNGDWFHHGHLQWLNGLWENLAGG